MRLLDRLPSFAGVTLLLALAACDGGGGGEPPPDDGPGDACYGAAEEVSGSIVAFGAPLTSSGCYAGGAMNETPGLGQAAVRGDAFAEAPTCGACLAVTGPGGSRVVRMIEECSGCSAIDVLDVDNETWSALGGGTAEGRLDVTVRAAPCPVDGGLRFVSSTGTNPWFVQLYVTNHRHPLDSVELRVAEGWVAMTRTAYGAFEWASTGATVESPYALRLTDVFGHVVEPTVAVPAGSSTTVAAQLPACG
jgi:expansin